MNKETILGLVRHILTFGGGYLVASDLIPAGEIDTLVGAIISIVGIVWSGIDKKNRNEA